MQDKNYRDADSGEFISEEDAKTRDKATVVAETRPKKSRKKATKKVEEEKFELPFDMIYKGKTYFQGQEHLIPEDVLQALLGKLIRMLEQFEQEGE